MRFFRNPQGGGEGGGEDWFYIAHRRYQLIHTAMSASKSIEDNNGLGSKFWSCPVLSRSIL